MSKFWLTLFLPNGLLIFWVILGKFYRALQVDTGGFCETKWSLEGGAFREKKSTRMRLFYCTTGNVRWGGTRERYKSSDCRRSLSWSSTFLVPKLMKYVRANHALIVTVLRKVSFPCCMFSCDCLPYQLYGFCSLLLSCSKYDLMFRNFTYINFAVVEISSLCNVGGSLIYLAVCIFMTFFLLCLPETFDVQLLICFVSCSCLVSSLVDWKQYSF